jgi:hypothetical protein
MREAKTNENENKYKCEHEYEYETKTKTIENERYPVFAEPVVGAYTVDVFAAAVVEGGLMELVELVLAVGVVMDIGALLMQPFLSVAWVSVCVLVDAWA